MLQKEGPSFQPFSSGHTERVRARVCVRVNRALGPPSGTSCGAPLAHLMETGHLWLTGGQRQLRFS